MRITNVKDLIQILTHIRSGYGINEIHRRTRCHKKTIRRFWSVAIENGWNKPGSSIPEEDIVSQVYRATFEKQAAIAHYLDKFMDEIKEWRDDKETYVVICHKLKKKTGKRVPESTLRDYVNRTFPKILKIENPRPNEEPGIAELDFGYLGITYDHQTLRNRKTWFISIRFRFSRHAVRKKLYCCDTINVLTAMVSIFTELGGVPKRIVIDNFKVAIKKAHRYDPIETQAFRQFAIHYGFIIEPCLPYTPEHKGGVENDIKYVKRNFWPLFRYDEKLLGHDVPYGDKIDTALSEWDTNIAGVRKIKEAAGFGPHHLFSEESKSLLVLPPQDFESYNELQTHVPNSYHVCYDNVYYSVPSQYRGKLVLAKVYATRVQILYKGELIALHSRSFLKGKRITDHTHCPKNMIEYLENTMPWLITKAKAIGHSTYKLIEIFANDKVRNRQGAIVGTLNLAKTYTAVRLEKACARALKYGNHNYQAVKNILDKHLEEESEEEYSDQNGQMYFTYARNSSDYEFTTTTLPITNKENNKNEYTYTVATGTY